jgi:hypothetical protein
MFRVTLKYSIPGIDMSPNVDAVPPPAVEVTPEPDAKALVGGVRLDLDCAVLRSQGPQGTVAMEELELCHPQEIAPRLWEEHHLLLKILLRRVDKVEA